MQASLCLEVSAITSVLCIVLTSTVIAPHISLRFRTSPDTSLATHLSASLMGDLPSAFRGRCIVSSREVLCAHRIGPVSLASEEYLGILHGTTFCASVCALTVHRVVYLSLLG